MFSSLDYTRPSKAQKLYDLKFANEAGSVSNLKEADIRLLQVLFLFVIVWKSRISPCLMVRISCFGVV